MIELVGERGYDGVTVRGLSRTGGVSTRTFYARFANVEECFASTYDSVMRTALRRVSAPGISGGDWEKALRGGLRALMEEIAANPSAARLALVEAFEAGPAMLKEMGQATRGFERFLDAAFDAAPEANPIPPPLVAGLAAGVERVARTKLLEGRHAELPLLAEELADWLLAVYVRWVGDFRLQGRAGHARSARPSNLAKSGDPRIPEFKEVGNERGRILAAVAKLAAHDGYWSLTIPKIRKAAGVSRRSFDVHFESVCHCFLEAIEFLTTTAIERAHRRALGADCWQRGVWQMILAFCTEVARGPAAARLGFLDVLAPGRAGLECRERLISIIATHLRGLAPPDPHLSALTSEAAAAASWRALQTEIAAGRASAAAQLVPAMSFLILAPVREAPGTASASRR